MKFVSPQAPAFLQLLAHRERRRHRLNSGPFAALREFNKFCRKLEANAARPWKRLTEADWSNECLQRD
jgi:hypothetical protein